MVMATLRARCGTGNHKSCAIPERLGFHREGMAKEAEWVNDRWVDLVVLDEDGGANAIGTWRRRVLVSRGSPGRRRDRPDYGRNTTHDRRRMGRKCLAFPVQKGRPDSIAVAAISASAS
jgi:hypothetical protein